MRFFSFSLSQEHKRQGLILFGLVVVYLLSRLLWLEQIPIFSDEAVHIARAKWALAGDVLAGLEMSKWLTMQAYGLYFGFFPDTLFSARALIVMIGLVNLLLIFKLARDFGEQPSFQRGLFAALMYLVSPFALLHDRLFVADQFQVFFFCGILIFTFRLLRQIGCFNWFNSLGLVFLLFLALLFKVSGLFFTLVPLIPLLLMDTSSLGASPRLRDRLLRLAPSYLLYAPLVLAFFLWSGTRADTGHFVGIEWADVLMALSINPALIVFYLCGILSFPFCLLLAASVLAALFGSKDDVLRKRVCICVGLVAVLLIPYMVLASVWALRYFLSILVPVCLLAGILMDELIQFLGECKPALRQSVARLAVLFGFLGFPFAYSVILITSFEGYPCEGNVELYASALSGSGVRDAARFLGRTANESPSDYIIVVSPDLEDGINQGLDVYWREMGSKVHHRVALGNKFINSQMRSLLLRGRPVYFARNDMRKEKDVMEMLQKYFTVKLCWHSARPEGYPGQKIFRIENK